MADPTLYLFDGYNLLHAGDFADRDELVDALASFVAARGARGFVVFDGVTMLDVSGPGEALHQAVLAGHPYTPVLVSPRGGAVRDLDGLADVMEPQGTNGAPGAGVGADGRSAQRDAQPTGHRDSRSRPDGDRRAGRG